MNAEIIARLDESLAVRTPKRRANIIVRLEALPPGSDAKEVSMAAFLTSFDQALRASMMTANPASDASLTRAPDSLKAPIDWVEDEDSE